MPHMPVLRVVPLESIHRHEEVDPLRVNRLMGRIADEGSQVNPMVCSEAPSGELVVLDGATRTEALKLLGLHYGVVQIVDPASVTLETWHHVVRQCPPRQLMAEVNACEDLTFTEENGTPRIHLADDDIFSVHSRGLSPNATLSALVGAYVGRHTVSRVTDPDVVSVTWRFPDWAAIIEFPTLTVEDVMKAALGQDVVPAGITRFLVPERALRLNADLSLLRSEDSLGEKQQALDSLLEARARAGRIRRYEEAIIILDD